MRKGSPIAITGFLLTTAGIIGIFGQVNITGFAITNFNNLNPINLFPVVFLLVGLLMLTSSDALQTWLERKEKEQASPSLEKKIKGINKKELSGRYSGKASFMDKLFHRRKVEQIPQDAQKYAGRSEYQTKPDQDKLISGYDKIKDQKIEKLRTWSEIKDLRERLFRGHEGYTPGESRTPGRFKDVSSIASLQSYIEESKKLEQLYEKEGMMFKASAAMRLLGTKPEKIIQEHIDHKEQTNISEVKSIERIGEIYPEGLENPAEITTFIKKYGATGLDLSEINKTRGLRFFHSIPGNKPVRQTASSYQSNGLIGKKYNKNPNNLTINDYLNFLASGDGAISTTSFQGEQITGSFGFSEEGRKVGVILKEGKLYDYANQDGGSELYGGMRFFNFGYYGDLNSKLDTSTNKKGYWDEAIIGKYTIGGIVVTKLRGKNFDSDALEAISYGKEHNIPIYEADTKGFLSEYKSGNNPKNKNMIKPRKLKKAA